jgi:hypothetical protein
MKSFASGERQELLNLVREEEIFELENFFFSLKGFGSFSPQRKTTTEKIFVCAFDLD